MFYDAIHDDATNAARNAIYDAIFERTDLRIHLAINSETFCDVYEATHDVVDLATGVATETVYAGTDDGR